jgi:hypothetical protein
MWCQAPPKKIPRTLENTREADETIVNPLDEEVLEDEAEDEFSNYFDGKVTPKILITTSTRPSHVRGITCEIDQNKITSYQLFFELKDLFFTLLDLHLTSISSRH